MHGRIFEFLEKHNILNHEQNGLRKGKSTTLAAFNLVKTVTENIDQNIDTIAFFFDMSKAFDFVSHDILLYKCERYGLRGVALDWLKSYLNNRRQYVEIKNINKNNEEVSFCLTHAVNNVGVPQGTILRST